MMYVDEFRALRHEKVANSFLIDTKMATSAFSEAAIN